MRARSELVIELTELIRKRELVPTKIAYEGRCGWLMIKAEVAPYGFVCSLMHERPVLLSEIPHP